ncbi:glycosyltransferase family 2 protein [Candidatus Beckwithbacteria bacterium]|nr:glycosyltransferase family 2 protein [Candidatus Beckwithbacteria bacterium]
MTNKISIILINYNTSDLTLKCVKSIQKSTYKNWQLIIIDNYSNQENKNKLAKIQDRKIKIIFNKQNLGFAKANNQGIKLALKKQTDYILVLNNDTEINQETLEIFVKSFEQNKFNKSNTILSSIIIFGENKQIWFNGLFDLPLLNFPKTQDKNKQFNKLNHDKKYLKSQYSTGCCMFFTKEFIKANGLMSEKYFLYFEDFSFSKGKNNIIIQEPLIKHHVSASSGFLGQEKISKLQAYYYGKNQIWYYFKDKKISFPEKIIFLLFTIWIRPILYIRDLPTLRSYFIGLFAGLFSKNFK